MYRLRLVLPLAIAFLSACPAPAQQQADSEEHNYLLRRQKEIFRLNVEADYAAALQKLCQTGYGDPLLCHPRAETKPISESPAQVRAVLPPPPRLPMVAEISGSGSDLAATLILPDGRRIVVAGGGRGLLPSGERVTRIDRDRVTLEKPGEKPVVVLLAEAAHP